MSESGLSLDDEILSPDIFSDEEVRIHPNNPSNSDDSSSLSTTANEPEPTEDVPEWKGVSMDEIHKGSGAFDYHELPPVCPSASHTVLFLLPLPAYGPPKAYPTHQVDKWAQGYVRMPHSDRSLYPVDQESPGRRCRNRWEIIQEALLQSFSSSRQIEAAILSYNHTYSRRWDFGALHHFFSEVLEEEETQHCFSVLVPKIVQLALQLPSLITGPIPLLKRHSNDSISLSQLQVASLLANAFFCTFPRRNSTNPQSEYASYPYINFNGLFSAFKEERYDRCASVMEKLKCILHYFRRVTSKAPEGVITIQRRYIPKKDCPKWDSSSQKLLPLHITSKGTIETEGAGLLQVDFANKYLGGGVLGLGCVQEEIRFVICPELMVTMLVTEALDDTEALVVTGVERYSNYEGYRDDFKWTGDYVDETPRDSSGRRMTSIVAIDALYFKHSSLQFNMSNVTRELNKAYVGFVGSEACKDNLPAIATGNWGCGAFRGNPRLKVLIQLMAAAAAGRSMVYFTFGDTKLRDDVAEMYWRLVEDNVDVGHLFFLLTQYQGAANDHLDFYRFLYNRSKMKPIKKYFPLKSSKDSVESTLPPRTSNMEESRLRNTSLQSSRTDNQRFFRNITGETPSQEKKIENWLASIDADNFDEKTDDLKKDSENENIVKGTEGRKSKADVTETVNGNFSEKKVKQSLWKILENRTPSKANEKMYERKVLSGLHLLGAKQAQITNSVTDNDVSIVKQQSSVLMESKELDNGDNRQTFKDSSYLNAQAIKQNILRKGGQKKISDFFQRAV